MQTRAHPRGNVRAHRDEHVGRSGGRWIGSLGRFLKLLVLSPFVPQLPGVRAFKDPEDDPLAIVTGFTEAGAMTPVVDSAYPLSAVHEAIRHAETGHARGRVVIIV